MKELTPEELFEKAHEEFGDVWEHMDTWIWIVLLFAAFSLGYFTADLMASARHEDKLIEQQGITNGYEVICIIRDTLRKHFQEEK